MHFQLPPDHFLKLEVIFEDLKKNTTEGLSIAIFCKLKPDYAYLKMNMTRFEVMLKFGGQFFSELT